MSGCVGGSERRARRAVLPAALAALLAALPAGAAPVPQRVVSINLCTDQLALLMAAPGQIVALTELAHDPEMSALSSAAVAYPTTRGRAEEVYLLAPDLVLAGAYTDRATVSMLQRLGVRVEIFPAGEGVDEMRASLTRMGELLGQPARAAALIADFDAGLAAITPAPGAPRATVYGPGGYAWGDATLAGTILRLAGFQNVATGPVLSSGGYMPLERLALARPDLIVVALSGGASRAEAVLAHPALKGIAATGQQRDADWVCAAPAILNAVADIARQGAALRRDHG